MGGNFATRQNQSAYYFSRDPGRWARSSFLCGLVLRTGTIAEKGDKNQRLIWTAGDCFRGNASAFDFVSLAID
jgi:hypothetical protein